MSKKILSFFIILCVIGGSISSAFAAQSRTPILSESKGSISGMNAIKFFDISGVDKILDFRFYTTNYSDKTYTAFSLEDPINPKSFMNNPPDHLNLDMIKAVLAISAKLNADIVGETIGESVTPNEYLASVQVALWKVVMEDSQIYKLDSDSIKNEHVQTVSDWLLKIGQEYLDRKPKDVSVSRYFLPKAEISVNSSRVEGIVEGQFNFYGPYFIESPDVSSIIRIPDTSSTYIIVNNVSGTMLSELKVNEPFYVRFDKSYTSDIEINLSASSNAPLYVIYSNLVFMVDNYEECETHLTISNSQTSGTIVYVKTDSVTDAVIPGVVLEIRDGSNALVTSMTTDENGVATSPLLRVGEYKLVEVNTAPGYTLDDTIHRANIEGSGQVIRLSSKGKATIAFVTFLLQNKASGSPVGGSIFEVINSDGVVETKIGFNSNGRCANVKLPDGRYVLREIVTDPNYELLIDRIVFECVASEITEVKIMKSATFSKTIFVVTDSVNTPVKDCVLELYTESASLIAELKCDNNGELMIGLPQGLYYVKQASGGNFYSGETYSFTVDATNRDNVVNVGVVKFESSISGVVYDGEGNPVPGVSLVAVDDSGKEYTVATTNFEGLYVLDSLPKGAVIFVTVYKAPYGFTGEIGNNKVITTSLVNAKNFKIQTMEEFNSLLEEKDQILSYPFYSLQSQISSEVSEEPSSRFGNLDSLSSVEKEKTVVTPDVLELPEVEDGVEVEVGTPPISSPEVSEDNVPSFVEGNIISIVVGGVVLVIVSVLVVKSKSGKKTSSSSSKFKKKDNV